MATTDLKVVGGTTLWGKIIFSKDEPGSKLPSHRHFSKVTLPPPQQEVVSNFPVPCDSCYQ